MHQSQKAKKEINNFTTMCPLNAHINQEKQKRKEIASPTITGLLGMETSPHTLTKSCQRIINLEINFVQL
jgi:hypothetical protein